MEGYTEVFAWGGDHFGQLGLGNKHSGKTYPSPRFCSFNVLIREISCGEEHSAFIACSGHVYCMGSNSEGRLGNGDKSMRSSSSPCLVEALVNHRSLKISCGWGHTGVITEDGSVFSWGVGEFGALGCGTSENLWTPTRVLLPRGARALDINCGSRHTGIIIEEGRNRSVMMAGSGEAGQLGTGKREKEFRFVPVSVGEEAAAVACGVFHSLVLGVSGKVYAMGGNSFGQLGLGTKKSCSRPERVALEGFVIKVACGSHSAAITDKGALFVWGTGVFGEYLVPTRLPVSACKDVSIGGNFGIALDVSGELFGWGANSNGELGVGDYEPKISPTVVSQLKGKTVKRISCGGNYVIALGADFGDGKVNQSLIVENEAGRVSRREDIGKRGESLKRSVELEKNRPDAENRVRDRLRESDGFRNREADRITPIKQMIRKNEENRYTEKQFTLENRKSRETEEIRKSEVQRETQNANGIRNALEDSQRQNLALSQELRGYKEEVQKLRRTIEELKLSKSYEASQKIDDLSQSLHHQHLLEVQDLKLSQEQEVIRRKQFEKNLEVSSKHIANLEEALQKSNFENAELRRQSLDNARISEGFKLTAQQEIEKSQRDNSELRRKIDLLLQEKERSEANMSKEIFELKRRIESTLVEKERKETNLESDVNLLESRCNELQQLINKLTAENQHLNTVLTQETRNSEQEITEGRYKLEQLKNEKESTVRSLQTEISEYRYKLEQLSNEKESAVHSLQSEISEYRYKLEKLKDEKENSILSLQSEISALNSELNSSKSLIEALTAQTHDLSLQISEKKIELSESSNNFSLAKSEGDYQKKLLEDLKYQNSKYQQDISILSNTVEKLRLELSGWESDYQNLLSDNRFLKESVTELELKNRQLFENLEKELAQRAKEYKERTISMLNTPGRSVSPYLKSHHRDRSDELFLTSNKIETEGSPGRVQNAKYLTIAQAYRGTATPTKDDVRTRIASLMKNRSRIEEQLSTIENE